LIGSIGYFVYPIILEIIFSIFCKMFTNTNSNLITKNSKSNFQNKLPIVYSSDYNITACGIEKLHPFDSCKYQKSKIIEN
jgi:histone deacetylase 11